MKPKLLLLTGIAVCGFFLGVNSTYSQGTAFTYQGQLQNNGSPARGTYDLSFRLFNSSSSSDITGVVIGGPVTNNSVVITNGLFTVAIDFGAGVFTGGSNWLEIAISTNGANNFIILTPRQQLTPTPYAIYAESAGGLPGLVVQQNTNGAPDLIGGSPNNFVSAGAVGATIGGGGATIYDSLSYANSVTGDFGTVGGGQGNTAGSIGTVGGGINNTAGAEWATVSGGDNNTASIAGATVPGGYNNTASGAYSFAAGNSAQALYDGDFVWADSQDTTFASTANDQFLIRALNGVGINANHPLRALQVGDSSVLGTEGMIHLASRTSDASQFILRDWEIGVPNTGDNLIGEGYSFVIRDTTASQTARFMIQYGTGNVGIGNDGPTHLLEVVGAYCDGNVWSPSSDRNLKSGFKPLDAGAVLAKVASLPITRWHYTNDVATSHVGPMAQDFYSAFAVGADDKHISDVDEGGVALAAIQGLNQKLEKKDAQIQDLKAQNDSLANRLNELEATVKQLAAQK